MKYDPMWMLWHWITRNSFCVALNSFWSSFVKRMYLFFKCVHTDFLTPVTNLFASSYLQMVLSTRHILQNSLRYLLLQICVVFIFVLVSCFANPKNPWHYIRPNTRVFRVQKRPLRKNWPLPFCSCQLVNTAQ